MLPEEQKGCRKGSRGTNDLLYIDRAVIKEVKSRNKNLAMAWTDYKKAYDMGPHSWIIECLDLFGVAENIKSLLLNSMGKYIYIYFFFSIWVFFHEHSRFTGQQGKGEGIYLTPLYHFHPLHRHLDISRAITAESSPLRIAGSRTRTGNLWFPSANR